MGGASAQRATPAAEDRETLLADGLAALAARLAEQLQGLDGDGALRRAVADLPDARDRLQAVVRLTEDAANRTLDLVEQAQGRLRRLEAHADPEVQAEAQALRQTCLLLAEAQGFQDLSGQIIGRVHHILETTQTGFESLLAQAGLAPLPSCQAPPTLAGPAVHNLRQADSATQDDADALMRDLGL